MLRCRDSHDVKASSIRDELYRCRWTQQCAPPAPFRCPHDHARSTAGLRIFDQRGGRRRSVQGHSFRAEGFREPQDLDAPVPVGLREVQQARSLDIHDRPVGIESIGHALAGAHELLGLRIRAHRDQNPVTREPGARSIHGKRASGRLHAIGNSPQRELAQRHEVRRAKEAFHGRGRLVRDIHLAGSQASQKIVGR